MLTDFLKYIRSKRRSEWREINRRVVLLIRDTLSKNGELSALIGLVAGISLVLFFKLLLVTAVTLSLVIFLIYQLAEDD